MGLADWWVSRSEAANQPVKSSKWGVLDRLKRAKSEPRKAFALRSNGKTNALPLSPRAQHEVKWTEEQCLELPFYRLSLRGDRLSASVNQAKDLLQQCAAVVSLYPSLVQLTVPCVRPCRPEDDLSSTKAASCSSVPAKADPVKDVQPRDFWVASEALLRFENEVLSLSKKEALDLRLTGEGCGGAYFMVDSTSRDGPESATPLGIFKPRDEEYMAPKNPRGYVKEHAVVGETEHPVNRGFRVGNGALRERAVYLLDEAYNNFSGVPVTSVVSLPLQSEVKEGSVQAFVESDSSAEDMGSLKFSVPEVHKIGILDVRVFNTDRHAGNILLRKRSIHDQTYAMTPIDHGFCLPSYKHLDSATFDWLNWAQAQYPFTSEELDHIASLDVAHDAAILRSLGIEEECITTMRICTTVLKIGADAGFSLFDIGTLLQRDGDFSQPSTLETLVTTATKQVEETIEDEESSRTFMDAVVSAVEAAVIRLFQEQPKKKVRSISCFS
ncbi:hypothetical protein Poli38472_006683 [Pythium oligandrum]|uniref:PI3K/PI4K catalytic domain-containing protein n=1 Tax=Pythium oligandrum TaxID=41045 RepID=A0A8K1C599_PYTOL|nr:hypothetical protein Poli38472_006683 [Pythium oligandrum]|eukprot:TMW56673.1 hypothetical protein Poli38472_006683 [Pythium oligandrum]